MATKFANPASQVLFEYLGLLDRIYGMYIDACMGFETIERDFSSRLGIDHSKRIFLGEFADPNSQTAKYNHSTTIGNFLFRNRRDSENQLLLSQSTIVFIYSIWDTMFRPKFANSLRKELDEIKCDVLGDLRHYRNAIVHNNMKLERPTRRLTFVTSGNAVVLKQEQMRELFTILFEDLSALNFEHTGERLNLPFYRNLNPPAS